MISRLSRVRVSERNDDLGFGARFGEGLDEISEEDCLCDAPFLHDFPSPLGRIRVPLLEPRDEVSFPLESLGDGLQEVFEDNVIPLVFFAKNKFTCTGSGNVTSQN